MTKYQVQNLLSLREELKAVARSERPPAADAAKPSFNSVDAVVRLLTPENRQPLAIIRDRKPQSIAELVELGRACAAQPYAHAGKDGVGRLHLDEDDWPLQGPERRCQESRRRDRSLLGSRPAQRRVAWPNLGQISVLPFGRYCCTIALQM